MSEAKPMDACEILPIDCWQTIFNLHNDGLKAVSLVCKDFFAISNVCKHSLRVLNPRIGILSKQVNRFKHLKEISIDLPLYGGDLEDAILEIVGGYDQIRDVENFDINSIQDQFKERECKKLASKSKMKKNLKALTCNIMYRKGMDDADLVLIANTFPDLEELNLGSNCKYFYLDELHLPTDYGVEYLASKLKLLKKIKIFGNNITDKSIVALSVNCDFLKHVSVWSYDYIINDTEMISPRKSTISENGIGFLLRNSPNLEVLKIGYIDILESSDDQSTITIENSVSHAKALTSLTFCNMNLSDSLLKAIAKAKLRLKKLVLRFCKFTVSGLHLVLSKSDSLTKLGIVGSDITDVDMELLLNGSDLGNLTHIDICQSRVTFSTLFLLSTKCASLVDIALDGDLQNYNVPLAKSHSKIQNLYLAHCDNIGSEWVKQVGLMFPNLRVVDLSFCRYLRSTGIEILLKSCKFIRKLGVSGFKGKRLFQTDNYSSLSEVNLEELALSDSKIDDEGLEGIAKLSTRLVSLDISFSSKSMTLEGVKQIVENITTLNYLDVRSGHDLDVELVEWMFARGNFGSLKKLCVFQLDKIPEKIRDEIFYHHCLLLEW